MPCCFLEETTDKTGEESHRAQAVCMTLKHRRQQGLQSRARGFSPAGGEMSTLGRGWSPFAFAHVIPHGTYFPAYGCRKSTNCATKARDASNDVGSAGGHLQIGAFGDSYASRRRRRCRSNTRSNVPLYLAQRSANISLLLASYHQAPERLRRA